MTVQRLGMGGLVSFVTDSGEFDFLLGHSKRTALHLSTPTTHSIVAGGLRKVDRAGKQNVPLDLVVHYEYLITPTTSLYTVQTQWDSLYTVYLTKQVGTLTVFAAGNSSVHIAGAARIEAIDEQDNEPNYMRLDLTFFCEAGMLG